MAIFKIQNQNPTEPKSETLPVDKTELVWPGKHKEVERVDLPFQTIETINLARGHRQEDIFDLQTGQTKLIEDPTKQLTLKNQNTDWKNRLIWGDNLLIMGSLLKEYAGKINLIYIDPPFATGDDFSFEVQIGDQEITKEPSALEVKAYRDTWGKGLQSYLQMMYDRLVLMKELLADDGSIYVHLDWHVGHYVKLLMDEIFGKEHLVNEIVWHYNRWTAQSNKYQQMHDTIFWFSKTENYKYNTQYKPYAAGSIEAHEKQDDLLPMYQVQLNSYALALPVYNIKPISKLSLLYCEPKEELDSDENFCLSFTIQPLEIDLQPEIIPELLLKARAILENNLPPQARINCKGICSWLEMVNKELF